MHVAGWVAMNAVIIMAIVALCFFVLGEIAALSVIQWPRANILWILAIAAFVAVPALVAGGYVVIEGAER